MRQIACQKSTPGTSNIFIVQRPLAQFRGTKLEHRQLAFFISQAAAPLGGHFDAEFWGVVVPQMACVEPSVQHAVIALASYHENWGDDFLTDVYERRFSFHYLCFLSDTGTIGNPY